MPELVRKETTVDDVRAGDKLLRVGTEQVSNSMNAPIVSVMKKITWCDVYIEGRTKPVRMRRDTKVVVLRNTATDEEKTALRNDMIREELADHLRKMLDNTPLKALTRITEKLESDAYDVLTAHNLPDVLQAQALYREALAIRSRLHRNDNEHVNIEDATLDELYDAYAEWLYMNTRHGTIWMHGNVNPLSRSTSLITNLLEDLEIWAMQRIMQEMQYTGASEEISRRATALTKKYS
jgi:hypothetical protein